MSGGPYSDPGKERFNFWRARYCSMMLYLMRENLLLKILMSLFCLGLGMAVCYYATRSSHSVDEQIEAR